MTEIPSILGSGDSGPPAPDPRTDTIWAVRLLIGDTTAPYRLADAHITYALTLADGDPVGAAARCARALAARYSARSAVRFDSLSMDFSSLHAHYEALARRLEQRLRRSGGIGIPLAGGIGGEEDALAEQDTDRIKPFFKDNLFNNPPPANT